MSAIERVGVVGCGAMGSGIAQVCATAGLDVRIAVRTADSLENGRDRLLRSLDRALLKGAVTRSEREDAESRIGFGTDLGELADCQLVVEAVRELEQDKVRVFAELDKVVAHERAVLASTTSSIPIVRLGLATRRPGQVVGLHFFSPVPAMPLVELIGSAFTAPETRERARLFVVGQLGKTAVDCPDRPGFVVNALLIPYLLSAVRMVESGWASAETVDQGMVLGCGHPHGPLKLADLIGLDVVAQIATALYEDCGEPRFAPPELLLRMVEAGMLGRKSGHGFYPHG